MKNVAYTSKYKEYITLKNIAYTSKYKEYILLIHLNIKNT